VSDINISDGGKIIKTAYSETECFEAYRIVVDKDGCTVLAADTEGIRRGLVFLEDEMLRREGYQDIELRTDFRQKPRMICCQPRKE
jgi:hypothetical protein